MRVIKRASLFCCDVESNKTQVPLVSRSVGDIGSL